MQQHPMKLESTFHGNTTFPHYLKFKDNDKGFDAEILFSPLAPVEKGTLVSKFALQVNTPVYKVEKAEGLRDARGEWEPYGFTPKWVKISAVLVGYWDNDNQVVVKEKIGQQPAKPKAA